MKSQSFFKKWDIVVYLILLVVIVGILLAVLLPQKEVTLTDINIYIEDELCYKYNFATKTGVKTSENANIVLDKDRITIYTKDGENIVKITENSAFMDSADCSLMPDCVHNFSPIEYGGDVIICLPHNIKIVGVGVGDNEVVI